MVTVILLPQVAKSRRMMGQARNDDRFSQKMRLLEVENAPCAEHSVEVAIHRNPNGALADKPVTRPIKMAQDLKLYTNLKARRAAAASTRANAARTRAILFAILTFATVLTVAIGALGLASWWLISAPVVGIVATLAWGTVAARNGRKQDMQFIADIRAVERRLEQSPAGREALTSGKKRDNNHWAKVAQESLNSLNEKKPEGTLSELRQKQQENKPATSAPIARQTPQETVAENQPGFKPATKPVQPATVKHNANEQVSSQKWNFTEIPAPTYTLRSQSRHEVTISAQATSANWEEAPVPMRPKTAQVLPADEALSSDEIQPHPVNLQDILDRRRA